MVNHQGRAQIDGCNSAAGDLFSSRGLEAAGVEQVGEPEGRSRLPDDGAETTSSRREVVEAAGTAYRRTLCLQLFPRTVQGGGLSSRRLQRSRV